MPFLNHHQPSQASPWQRPFPTVRPKSISAVLRRRPHCSSPTSRHRLQLQPRRTPTPLVLPVPQLIFNGSSPISLLLLSPVPAQIHLLCPPKVNRPLNRDLRLQPSHHPPLFLRGPPSRNPRPSRMPRSTTQGASMPVSPPVWPHRRPPVNRPRTWLLGRRPRPLMHWAVLQLLLALVSTRLLPSLP